MYFILASLENRARRKDDVSMFYFEGASQSMEGEGTEDEGIAASCAKALASALNKS